MIISGKDTRTRFALLAAALAACLASCEFRKPQRKRVDLTPLRAELKQYDFGGRTAGVIKKLEIMAGKGKGMVAAEAHFLVGRALLDWIVAATFIKDVRLAKGLLAAAGVAKACTSEKALDDIACRQALLKQLERRFRAAALSESGRANLVENCCWEKGESCSGAFVEDACYVLKFARLFLVHRFFRHRAYHQGMGRLIGLRNPAGTRSRVTAILETLTALRQFRSKNPLEDGWKLAALFPYGCYAIKKASSPAYLAREAALKRDGCSYLCTAAESRAMSHESLHSGTTARKLPGDLRRADFWLQTARLCMPSLLGSSPPEGASVLTPQAFAAHRTLRLIVDLQAKMALERQDPLARLFKKEIDGFLAAAARLQVSVPYPPALRVQRKLVRPAAYPGRAHPLTSTVGLVVSPEGLRVALAPRARLVHGTVSLMGSRRNLVWPGRGLNVGLRGPFVPLDRGLWEAARLAASESGTSSPKPTVALYVDGGLTLQKLRPLLKHLRRLGSVELAVSDGESAGRAIRLRLGKPPGTAAELGAKTGGPVDSVRLSNWSLTLRALAVKLARASAGRIAPRVWLDP